MPDWLPNSLQKPPSFQTKPNPNALRQRKKIQRKKNRHLRKNVLLRAMRPRTHWKPCANRN
jgi:hypothetical protein